MKGMKIKNISLYIIAWYNLLIAVIAIFIYLYNIIKTSFNVDFAVLLVSISFLLIEFIHFSASYILIKRNGLPKCDFIYCFVLLYSIAQSVVFGCGSNNYTFITGPDITIYIKQINGPQFGYFLKGWIQEFFFHINYESGNFYFGLNLIPLIITVTMLVILWKQKSISFKRDI